MFVASLYFLGFRAVQSLVLTPDARITRAYCSPGLEPDRRPPGLRLCAKPVHPSSEQIRAQSLQHYLMNHLGNGRRMAEPDASGAFISLASGNPAGKRPTLSSPPAPSKRGVNDVIRLIAGAANSIDPSVNRISRRRRHVRRPPPPFSRRPDQSESAPIVRFRFVTSVRECAIFGNGFVFFFPSRCSQTGCTDFKSSKKNLWIY